MAGAGEFDVSIVVICFDRMQLLERTLRACMAQAAPAGARWEIVVADNHPDQLAAPLVARLGADARLRHVAAWPAKNIAAARNAGVAAARGRMVAFCDDDEAPDPDWMIEHLACLRRTGADASFGPKYPVFEGGAAPPWDPDGWFFTVDFGLPPDADIRPLEWSLRGGRGVGAGNSMLLAARCLAAAQPFDERYGRTGGEDTLLFFGLAKQRRRFVWCPSARVTEFNARGRMTQDYMLARLRRSAQHSANCRMAVCDNRLAMRLGIFGVGAAQLAAHGALRLATLRAGPARRAKHRFGIAKALGKLGIAPPLDFVPEHALAPAGVAVHR